MLTIEHLSLALPAGYQQRAHRIARLIGDELELLPVPADASGEPLADRSVARLRVPRIAITRGATDRQIARRVARAIHRSIYSTSGHSPSSGREKSSW